MQYLMCCVVFSSLIVLVNVRLKYSFWWINKRENFTDEWEMEIDEERERERDLRRFHTGKAREFSIRCNEKRCFRNRKISSGNNACTSKKVIKCSFNIQISFGWLFVYLFILPFFSLVFTHLRFQAKLCASFTVYFLSKRFRSPFSFLFFSLADFYRKFIHLFSYI